MNRKKIPFKVYVEISRRDKFICQICGLKGEWKSFQIKGNFIRIGVFYNDGKFEIDHINPIFKGGNNNLENLRLSCIKCNRSKGSK